MRIAKPLPILVLVLGLAVAPPLAAQESLTPPEKSPLEVATEKAAVEVVSESRMRTLTFRTASAPQTEADRRAGLWKIVGGVGIASTGVLLAASSGGTITITSDSPFGGTAEISSRSTGQLVAGLAMIGGGALLAVLGVKQRNP